MGDMTLLSDVGCPLIRCTHPDDALVNSRHEFQFWNISDRHFPCGFSMLQGFSSGWNILVNP